MSLGPIFFTFCWPPKPRFLRKPRFVKVACQPNPVAECRPRITEVLPKAPVLMGFRFHPPSADEPVRVPKYAGNQLDKNFERVGQYMRKAISEHGGG